MVNLLVVKANCVASTFGSKNINDNLDNPSALTSNKSNAYENCVNFAGGSAITSTITCSGIKCSSCKAALQSNPGAPSGTYTIDPTGSSPFQVYCDMTNDGGGWTLVLKNVTNNSDFNYSSANWTSGTPFNNSNFDLWNNGNALYQSYNTLSGTEFKVQFESNGSFIITTPTLGTAKDKATGATYKQIECSTSGSCWYQVSSACTDLKNTFHPSWILQGGYIGKVTNRVVGVGVRFGMLGNNETVDEGSMDSSLGLGLVGTASSGNQRNGAGVACDYPTSSAANTAATSFWKALLWVR